MTQVSTMGPISLPLFANPSLTSCRRKFLNTGFSWREVATDDCFEIMICMVTVFKMCLLHGRHDLIKALPTMSRHHDIRCLNRTQADATSDSYHAWGADWESFQGSDSMYLIHPIARKQRNHQLFDAGQILRLLGYGGPSV